MTFTRRKAIWCVIRVVAIYVSLCLLTYSFGDAFLRAATPILRTEIESAFPEHHVAELVIDEGILRLTLASRTGNGIGRRVKMSNTSAFTYPILVLTLLLVWPFGRNGQRITAVAVASILLFTLVMIDLPVAIALAFSEMIEREEPYLLFLYNNGGRQFQALIVLGVSIGASKFVEVRARRRTVQA